MQSQKKCDLFIFLLFFLAQYIFLIYLCIIKREETTFSCKNNLRRGGRVVDCTGLENRRTERYRGFESLSLRKKKEAERLPFFYIRGDENTRAGVRNRRSRLPKQESLSLRKKSGTTKVVPDFVFQGYGKLVYQ